MIHAIFAPAAVALIRGAGVCRIFSCGTVPHRTNAVALGAKARDEMIAQYYDKEAADNEQKAELHRVSKNIFYKAPNQLHCSELIKAFQEAAGQDKALAASHREMAKKAGAEAGQ